MKRSDFGETTRLTHFLRKKKDTTSQKLADELEILLSLVPKSEQEEEKPDMQKMIFVFGSNLAGIHGAGAARVALEKHGAILHEGHGPQGNSYAIPTKDEHIETLPLGAVKEHVKNFLAFAKMWLGKKTFQVTAIGCGLAGFKHEQIAPLFKGAPENCYFDTVWKEWLGNSVKYWGTYPASH